MKQKEIWFANLHLTKGKEQTGRRPVVIISGNAMNDNLGVMIVCPLTTRIKHFAGCVVLNVDDINRLDRDSEVLTFQVRALAKERFLQKIGEITEDQLNRIKTGLNEILTY